MAGKAAARVFDLHMCPKQEPGPVPHVGAIILPAGCSTVLIGGKPAAREGDQVLCVGPLDKIKKASKTVMIGGKNAARVDDLTDHGGKILPPGCPTVLIGG